MDETKLYEKIKNSNVKENSNDFFKQCSRYKGVHIHRVSGSFRQHFFIYTLEKPEVDFETDLTYEEFKQRYPEDYAKTISVILEGLEKKIIKI